VLEPMMLPPECPTCGRTFLSWPSVSRHLRLDHTPADEDEQLTVDVILAARSDEEPPPAAPAPTRETRLQDQLARPWLLGAVVWLVALYGLSRLGIPLATLVAWSFVGAAVVGVVVVRAWARSELQLQQSLRRRDQPPL
jgi:hypothetical protein